MPDQRSTTDQLHTMLGIIAGIRAGYVPTPAFVAETIEPNFDAMTLAVKTVTETSASTQIFDPEKVRALLEAAESLVERDAAEELKPVHVWILSKAVHAVRESEAK